MCPGERSVQSPQRYLSDEKGIGESASGRVVASRLSNNALLLVASLLPPRLTSRHARQTSMERAQPGKDQPTRSEGKYCADKAIRHCLWQQCHFGSDDATD